MRSPSRPPSVTLPALLLLALGLRLLSWSRVVLMMNDGPDFLWQARRFLDGDPLAAIGHPYHPLYGAVVALASRIAPDLPTAGAAVSVLGGLLAVLAAWGLGRAAFPASPWAPAASALVAAVHTRAVRYSADVQSEGLFMGLFAVAAWALLDGARGRSPRGRLALAGVCVGLGYLVRPEALLLVFALPIWWIAARRRADLAAPPRAGLAAFAVAVALAVLPYAWAIHELTGHLGISMKPSMRAFALTDVGESPPLQDDSPLNAPIVPRTAPRGAGAIPSDVLGAQHARSDGAARATAAPDAGAPDPSESALARAVDDGHPRIPDQPDSNQPDSDQPVPDQPVPDPSGPDGHIPDAPVRDQLVPGAGRADGVAPDEAHLGRGETRPAPVAALADLGRGFRVEGLLLLLCGLLAIWRSRPGLLAAWAALMGVYFALCTRHVAEAHLSSRHVVPALVLSLPVMGAGVALLATRGRWTGRVLLAAALFTLADAGVRDHDEDRGPRLAALRWVSEHTAPDEGIAVTRRRDGFYAQRHVLVLRLPCDDRELLRLMARHRIGALVVDVAEVERHAPHWLDGLDGLDGPDGARRENGTDVIGGLGGGPFVERARFTDPGGPGEAVVVLTPAAR